MNKLFLFLFLLTTFPLFSQNKIFVQAVHISGNQRTKESVITREMTFHIGDSLEINKLSEIIDRNHQNIYNLGLFNVVKLLPDTSQKVLILTIELKERWYIFPNAGATLEERGSYDVLQKIIDKDLRSQLFHRLSVYGLVGWRNVTGRNNTLAVFGQVGFSNRFTLFYTHPWLFPKQKTDFSVIAQYVERKELIYNTINGKVQWGRVSNEPLQTQYALSVSLRKRFTVFKSLYAQLGYQYHHFSDSIANFNSEYITNQRFTEHYPSLTLVFQNDKRDIKAYPLKGWRYRFFGRFNGYLPNSTSNFVKLGASWAHFVPIYKRWYFAYNVQNIITLGKKIPYYEKNFLWIDRQDIPDFYNELRGFEQYAADAANIFIQKAEFRYAIFPRKMLHIKQIPFKKFQDMPLGLFLTAFADGGYMTDNTFNNNDNFLKNKYLYGYGVGLNAHVIYDLTGRFEVSYNSFGQFHFNMHALIPIK
jgi:outer membrane protein assembly factor BamA